MASIFTFQEEPPRVHSPWSTPGHATPQNASHPPMIQHVGNGSYTTSITRLEPERHDGPTEYKLHLLLRLRGTATIASPLTTQSRQARLQQLTTQLLWRLQQSSPFHSASNANLVLPLLPEATPKLGVPDRPAKLLPGLEESQGALYEIGVADDGTLMGLYEDELEESLTNLRAMAASLGCVVDILRRVLVGPEEEPTLSNNKDYDITATKLWAAEVLVRPEVRTPKIPPIEKLKLSMTSSGFTASDTNPRVASTEQIRVAVVGSSSAGKSSLVGTLTTSRLDNGRGRSRLSLLKHRHEIASGVTSSVAQELIGYHATSLENNKVINYASGDVSSWPDIHGLSNRLVFLSDSPGLPRYAKSTFRSVVSWRPDWTLLCVAADAHDIEVSSATDNMADYSDAALAHLHICLKLKLQLMVVITKMDIATKGGLKLVLSKILSILKNTGRIPVLLGAPSATIVNTDENVDIATQLYRVTAGEESQLTSLLQKLQEDRSGQLVPIVLSSAVTGVGFGKLHALLKDIPPSETSMQLSTMDTIPAQTAIFHVDETFAIPPSRVYSANKQDHSADHGIVLCGLVTSGSISIGDTLRLGPFWVDSDITGENEGPIPRSASYSVDRERPPIRSLSAEFSKSLQGEKISIPGGHLGESSIAYMEVHVVSLRSLRLPVRTMARGNTGTVGVQPVCPTAVIPLSRARKGMVLSSLSLGQMAGYRSFSAVFGAAEFASMNTAPLILGGHAIVYINSIRAAVKVTVLALHDEDSNEASASAGVFNFDEDNSEDVESMRQEIRITFNFVSSVEWMEVGDKALIVPTLTAAGPVSRPSNVNVTGLSGFVGVISEVFT